MSKELTAVEFRLKVLERFPFCSEDMIKFNYGRYLSLKGQKYFKHTKKNMSLLALGLKAKFKRLDINFLKSI